MRRRPVLRVRRTRHDENETNPRTPAGRRAALTRPQPSPLEDLLRAETSKLAPKEEGILRGRLMARIIDAIGGMKAYALQEIARCIDICRNDHGCSTPSEQFISRLVIMHFCAAGPLTPDGAEEALKEYREEFASAIDEANTFNTRYSAFLKQQ